MIVVSVSGGVQDPGSTPGRSTSLVEEMKMPETQAVKLVGKDEFECYTWGLCQASACTSLTDVKNIEFNMNAAVPTGISSRWVISDKPFKTGEPNPCHCDKRPSTHKHYLFAC